MKKVICVIAAASLNLLINTPTTNATSLDDIEIQLNEMQVDAEERHEQLMIELELQSLDRELQNQINQQPQSTYTYRPQPLQPPISLIGPRITVTCSPYIAPLCKK